jgi:prepilin-type N-terminal cleavage/methylation domain-containing protein
LRSHPIHTRPIGRRAGLTLIELIIGLSITAVIASIIAVLINATAMGTTSQQDGRRLLVRFQAIRSAVSNDLSNAKCILDVGPNYIVYWIGDDPAGVVAPNNAVNLSELRMLEVDTAGNLNLYRVQWPATFKNADILSADQTYAANTAWHSAVQNAATAGYLVPAKLASNATGLAATLDSATLTSARMVTLSISLNDTVTTRTIVLGAAIHSPTAPW